MFKLNQKVVCIDATDTPQLEENEIYTITGIVNVPGECVGVTIKETKPQEGFEFFAATRFREIDNSFGSDVLAYIEEEIEETYV